jgi:hypothetical protein
MADLVVASRYVNIPCPSGKHQQSIVTFRDHTVSALFCIPCEHAWTESSSHPELEHLLLDSDRGPSQ